MISKARELLNEQTEFLGEQAKLLRSAPGELVRNAAAKSAQRIKSLKDPVRVVTRSGVKLTNISQDALQNLLELQLEIVTSALSNAAAQLDRVAKAGSLRELVGVQAEELKAARERISKDVTRVVEILRAAGRGVRNVATDTIEDVRNPSKPAARRTPARRKAKAKRARKTAR
jgi:phasin family protein